MDFKPNAGIAIIIQIAIAPAPDGIIIERTTHKSVTLVVPDDGSNYGDIVHKAFNSLYEKVAQEFRLQEMVDDS